MTTLSGMYTLLCICFYSIIDKWGGGDGGGSGGGGGGGGGGGCHILCFLNQGGDPMTVELATHTGALLETKVC